MKILESYKKIAKSMLIEHAWDRKFGEPLPTLEDVMNEADVKDKKIKFKDKDDNDKEATVGGILKKGEKHPAYDDAKAMIDKGGDKKSDAGKLGGGDYERDFDDSEPEDKPFGGDTGKDADYGGGDFTKSADYDMWSDDEDDEEAAKAQAFKDMEDEFDDTEEESITINGKQYRPIKDSVEPKKHLLREMYERIGGK